MTNKNEIVARWMGIRVSNHNGVLYHCDEDGMFDWRDATVYAPSKDRNNLHSAWEKFRDLKLINEAYYFGYCDRIRRAITDGTITEALDELCKGIEWAESLKQ
jgi:hypothetical protein